MTTQFKVDQTYTTRSAFDHNCVYSFTVTKRTAKTVWLRDNVDGKVRARRVRVYEGREQCDPKGQYSFSPVLNAG